jgi:sugar/nucleoside kinase (ribokinase family)
MIERIIRAMAVLVGSAYAFGGSGVTSGERPVVLGLGAACVDYVVQVDNYPPADAKVRTECFDTMGGGNCANTLTALSRLGVRSKILTKIGNDAIGEGVIKDLELEGIDVSLLKRYEGPSASTYIIVDRTAHTRTCFHTPGKEELLPREVDPSIDLIGVDLLHLDGRMTLAAIKLAKSANTQGIPVTLDVEKDRPHLCELLPLADYIFTNSNFPATYTDAPTRAQAMEKLLHVGRAKMVVTTMGADGCLVMCKR